MQREELGGQANQQKQRAGSLAVLLSLTLCQSVLGIALNSGVQAQEVELRISQTAIAVPTEPIAQTPTTAPSVDEPLIAEPPIEEQSSEAPTVEEQPAEEQPVEEQTVEEQPTEAQGVEERSPATTEAPTPVESPSESPSPENSSTQTEENKENEKTVEADEPAEPAPTPEELSRQQKLIQADQLYLGGQFDAANILYREAKIPFPKEGEAAKQLPEPILDPTALPPAGQVFWREAEAGIAQKLETRTMVPLNLLVEKYPQFVPGQLRLAEVLQSYDRTEEALTVLERATTLYPAQPDLLKAKVALLAETEQWLEASIAARQFALLNPQSPDADEFATLAEDNLKRFQAHMRRELRGSAIANVVTGALGYVLTGNIFGPLSAVQTTALLLRGESSVGESAAKQAKNQLELVEDPMVVDYVNEIGRRIATVAGRDFDYEFYVVMDDRLNAFALPGGKVFINAGAIAKTNSEAELAGLIAHELSHAVLSHGFQLVTEGNLIANTTQYLPLGGTIANIFVADYSRDMERQSDILGTRILASTGYAADGLRNLMVTLEKEDKESMPFSWLSSHPVTNERIRYLESLILDNGYNRYAYEGVARHDAVKTKVKEIITERKKQEAEKKKRRRQRER